VWRWWRKPASVARAEFLEKIGYSEEEFEAQQLRAQRAQERLLQSNKYKRYLRAVKHKQQAH
jgi:hypothetical protein